MTTNRFLSSSQAVAETVRDQRRALGLTQQALADRASVGRKFIVELEAGHPRAELDAVLKVLAALDVHAYALPPQENDPTLIFQADVNAVLDEYLAAQ